MNIGGSVESNILRRKGNFRFLSDYGTTSTLRRRRGPDLCRNPLTSSNLRISINMKQPWRNPAFRGKGVKVGFGSCRVLKRPKLCVYSFLHVKRPLPINSSPRSNFPKSSPCRRSISLDSQTMRCRYTLWGDSVARRVIRRSIVVFPDAFRAGGLDLAGRELRGVKKSPGAGFPGA